MNKLKKFLERTFQFFAIAGLLSFNFITPAFAAVADDMSVLLSDSRPSTVADWTITYDQGSGGTFSSGDTFVLTIPTGFSIGSVDETDIDFQVAAADETLQTASCGATDTIRYTVASQVMTFEACSSYTAEAAGSIIEIQIGLNAAGGNAQITNNTAAVYTVTANATDEDAKDALIAIVAGVTLTATVDETLTFTIAGVAAASCDVTGGTEVSTPSATAINYDSIGTLSSDTFYDGCQSLTVGTNASGGYIATIQTTSLPTSGGDTIAKGTCDGACSDSTLAAWATATNNGYGFCTKDETGDAAATASRSATNECGDGTQHFTTIANAGGAQTAQTIMSSAAATSTNDISEVGHRLTFGSGQAAGTYVWTVVYIATATF